MMTHIKKPIMRAISKRYIQGYTMGANSTEVWTCPVCQSSNGCNWVGGNIADEQSLTADDWRLIYNFIRYIELPFIHKIITIARERGPK